MRGTPRLPGGSAHPGSSGPGPGTLDHLSRGRIAWNVVTSYKVEEALNFGYRKFLDHDHRSQLDRFYVSGRTPTLRKHLQEF